MEKTKQIKPIQNQFISQDICKVIIRPTQPIEKLTIIVENYGPFEVGEAYSVPLWLAIYFKQTKMCRIDIPQWLMTSVLEIINDEEKNNVDDLVPLDYYYLEIAYLLMKYASDDFDDIETVKSLFEDIRIERMEKLRKSLLTINKDSETVGFQYASATEISLLRDYIITIFDSMSHLSNTVDRLENTVDYRYNLRNIRIETQEN